MPNCSLLGCRSNYRDKKNGITLHRLPTNKRMRKLWLDIIGIENLKRTTKAIAICSRHFEESCINRTLNKVTLRDDVVPSRDLLLPSPYGSGISKPINENETAFETEYLDSEYLDAEYLDLSDDLDSDMFEKSETVKEENTHKETLNKNMINIVENSSPEPDLYSSTSATSDAPANALYVINKLKEKCKEKSRKIKNLNEAVRRYKKRVFDLNNIIKDYEAKLMKFQNVQKYLLK